MKLSEIDFQDLSENDLVAFVKRYKNNPSRFAKEILQLTLDKPQEESIDALAKNKYVSIKSGHGVGKSTLASILILWFLSTRIDAKVTVASNTFTQLKTRTWSTLAQTLSKALNRSWFTATAMKLSFNGAEETWFALANSWSDNNFESFQGIHAEHVLMIFDEASAIPQGLFEVAMGAMTTKDCKMLLLGNPTRGTGYFHDTFNNTKWTNITINSEESQWTNKEQLKEWENEYGRDSDFYRVRVLGLFPKTSYQSIISNDELIQATKRTCQHDDSFVKVLGVDIARFGSDDSVFTTRYGLDIKEIVNKHGFDANEVESYIQFLDNKHNYDYIVLDATGIGGPIYDHLKKIESLKSKLIPIEFGSSPQYDTSFANKRAEMYGRLDQLLRKGLCIPNDEELLEELRAQEYFYNNSNKKILIPKDKIKDNIGRSPDKSDSVALTTMVPDLIFKVRKSHSMDQKAKTQLMFRNIAKNAKWG